jgi:hypothetical protein
MKFTNVIFMNANFADQPIGARCSKLWVSCLLVFELIGCSSVSLLAFCYDAAMKIQLTYTILLLTFSFSLLAETPEPEKTPDVLDVSEPLQTPDVTGEPGPADKAEPVKTNKPPKVPETMDPRGKALFQGAFDGNLTQVQTQVTKGADVNYADKKQRTALILAANNGHTTVVEFLFSKGADINAKDKGGMTALMYTAKRSFNETAAFLLNNGAKVNVQNRKKGMTALMLASGWGNAELVQMLLDKGADPTIHDKFGATAADNAKERSHSAIVSMLSETTAAK